MDEATTLTEHLLSHGEFDELLKCVVKFVSKGLDNGLRTEKDSLSERGARIQRISCELASGRPTAVRDALAEGISFREVIDDMVQLQEHTKRLTDRIPVRFVALDREQWRAGFEAAVERSAVVGRSVAAMQYDGTSGVGRNETQVLCASVLALTILKLVVDALMMLVADLLALVEGENWPTGLQALALLVTQALTIILAMIDAGAKYKACEAGA